MSTTIKWSGKSFMEAQRIVNDKLGLKHKTKPKAHKMNNNTWNATVTFEKEDDAVVAMLAHGKGEKVTDDV